MSQINEQGVERPVAYTLRTLSHAEHNYSQLENGMLTLIFSTKIPQLLLWMLCFIVYRSQTTARPFKGIKSYPYQASVKYAQKIAQNVFGNIPKFLNQACAGYRPTHAWFLKIDSVRIVGMRACVRVCPCPRLLITSGMMWHDMKPI